MSSSSFQDRLPLIEPGSAKEGRPWQLKVQPGISTFGSRSAVVGEMHLKKLILFAQDLVPSDQHAATPLYLYATAGMRLLPEHEQRDVMRESCAFIKQESSFALVKGCQEHVGVISGEREGLYGWLTVNYLLKGFQKTEGDVPTTFGFLDMGGASAQVAYEMPSPSLRKQHANDLQSVELTTLDGQSRSFHVFVTTFLGYGANEARKRYLDQLKATASATGEVTDPCLPKETTLEEEAHQDLKLKLKGSGDWQACLDQTHPLLNKEAPCPDQPCVFNGVHAPGSEGIFSKMRFIGVSVYWYTLNEIYNVAGSYDYQRLFEKAKDFCSRSWTLIRSQFDAKEFGETDTERLQKQCFKTSWLMNVLHKGFGLPTDTIGTLSPGDPMRPFRSVDTVDGFSVSWTLGVALSHAAEHARESYRWPSQASLFLVLFIVLAVAVFFASRFLTTRYSDDGLSGVQQWMQRRGRYHPLSRPDLESGIRVGGGLPQPFPMTQR